MSDLMKLPMDQDASGRSFGSQELAYLKEVLDSGKLFGPKGQFVKRLEDTYAKLMGMPHARAVSSGTAGVHCAVMALDLEPGSEILTTPITDMGAILPIMFQGCVPIFCDVDPATLNVTADTLEARITERTKAIIITHLFGLSCDMTSIMELAAKHDIMVIEDCSQSYLATHKGKLVGGYGDIGVFSLQQGKHATCGEGGLIVSNDAKLARRAKLSGDKAWPYGESNGDHEFLSTNYRMSELEAAVALAQIEKLEANTDTRCKTVAHMQARLEGIHAGVTFPTAPDGDRHTYWRIPIMIDKQNIPGGVDAVGKYLREYGVVNMPRYIVKPAFMCDVIRNQVTFGTSRWPFSQWEATTGKTYTVDPADFPGTYKGLESVIVIPWNEKCTIEHADFVADALKRAVAEAVASKTIA